MGVRLFIPAGLTGTYQPLDIVPEPLHMIANPEEASEVDNLDDTFDRSFSSVEDSFTEA
ncbi:hypothetical protein RvY_17026 [Ramazzottius varieornatus]|uniref:Uncharacterized protein n=1 Tax=Ramazzottius varieornatus TaxID=947166 RepID=A0A1D1W168_RAMVA|nr:hypothetical protein RvY_17026 [Ramazzottius varieornatus]